MNKLEALQVVKDVFGPELGAMIQHGRLEGHARLVEALSIVEKSLTESV